MTAVARRLLRDVLAWGGFALAISCNGRTSPTNEATSLPQPSQAPNAPDRQPEPARPPTPTVQRVFTLGPDAEPFQVKFEVTATSGGQVIRTITIAGLESPARVQHMDMPDMEPIATDEDLVTGAQDINFDGYADLYVVTRTGASNVYATYWLFSAANHRFEPLGEFPELKVNAHRRRLASDETLGHAGREYEHRDYGFVGNRLTVLRSVRQVSTGKPGEYERVESARRNRELLVVRRERVITP